MKIMIFSSFQSLSCFSFFQFHYSHDTRLHTRLRVKNSDHYITAVTWIDSSTLSVSWMNRAQNVTILSKCSEEIDWMCEKVGSGCFLFPKRFLNLNSCPTPWFLNGHHLQQALLNSIRVTWIYFINLINRSSIAGLKKRPQIDGLK